MKMHSPLHPGKVLRGLLDGIEEETGTRPTIGQLAESLDVSRKTVSDIVNTKSRITPDMALRLAIALPKTSAEHWLRMQENYDLAEARKMANIDRVRVLWPIPNLSTQGIIPVQP